MRVLEGTQEDDRLFALIYTVDPEDDPWDEATWIKANPSWGQAVQPDAIRAIMRQARNNPAQEAAAKTRHLNIWVGADEALFSHAGLARGRGSVAEPRGLRGPGVPSRAGSRQPDRPGGAGPRVPGPDPETGRTTYTAFARCYLNEAAVMEARNPATLAGRPRAI